MVHEVKKMNKVFWTLIVLCVLSLGISFYLAGRLKVLEIRYDILLTRLESDGFSLDNHKRPSSLE